MTSTKSSFAFNSVARLLIGAMILSLCIATGASAQVGTIDAGTTLNVRTNQTIDVKENNGQTFSGVVDQDVMNRQGTVAIPRGSNVELVVRNVSNNEMALDVNAITVNGQRYTVDTQDNVINSQQKEGIGANKRTGKYVGGGAVLGAIIGAIAGGGKGAAIGWRRSRSRSSGPDSGQERKCSSRILVDVPFAATAANRIRRQQRCPAL